jgi:hypothetical protein
VKEHPEDPAQPGELVITWKDNTTTTVRWPFYANAGHAVAMTMPKKLLTDVTEWMDPTPATGRAYARWALGKGRIDRWKAKGVRIRAVHPGARVGSDVLFALKPASLGGAVRFQNGRAAVVLRSWSLDGRRVRVQVKGRSIVVLKVKGPRKTAVLTPAGAKALNSGLNVTSYQPGAPMGRFIVKGTQ